MKKIIVLFASLILLASCNMEKGESDQSVSVIGKDISLATSALVLNEDGSGEINIHDAAIVELADRPKHGDISSCKIGPQGATCIYTAKNSLFTEDTVTFNVVNSDGRRNAARFTIVPLSGEGQIFRSFNIKREGVNSLEVQLRDAQQFSVSKYPSQTIISNIYIKNGGLVVECIASDSDLSHDQMIVSVTTSKRQIELTMTFNIEKAVDSDGDGIYDHIERAIGRNPLINEIPFIENITPLYAELSVSDRIDQRGEVAVLKQTFEREGRGSNNNLLRNVALGNIAKQRLGNINMNMRARENGGIVAQWGHEEVLDAKIQAGEIFTNRNVAQRATFRAQFEYAIAKYPHQEMGDVSVRSMAARGSTAREFSIAVSNSALVKTLSRGEQNEIEIEAEFINAKEGIKSLLGGDNFIVDIANYSYTDNNVQKEYIKEIEKAEKNNVLLLISSHNKTEKYFFAPGLSLKEMLNELYSSNSFTGSGRIVEVNGLREDELYKWYMVGKCDGAASVMLAGEVCHIVLARAVEIEKSKRYIKGMDKQRIDSVFAQSTNLFTATQEDTIVLRGKLSGTRISTAENIEMVEAIYISGYDPYWCHNSDEDEHYCPPPKLPTETLKLKKKNLIAVNMSDEEIISSAKLNIGDKEIRLNSGSVKSMKRRGEWIILEAQIPKAINDISTNTKIGLEFDEYCETVGISYIPPQLSGANEAGQGETGFVVNNDFLLEVNNPKVICRKTKLTADIDVLVE